MSINPPWKNRERQVANYFDGERTPLSGGHSRITRADVIHDNFFIEIKTRKKHSAVTLWDKTKIMAHEEKKTPIIVLCENNRKGFWILTHCHELANGKSITQCFKK